MNIRIFVYNTYYDQISKIAINIVPECVDSMEAGEILFECINQAMDLSPEERRKRIQSEIKKHFILRKTERDRGGFKRRNGPLKMESR